MASNPNDKHLEFTLLDGPDVPEALLRELWELRVEMLTLRRSREDDWAYFEAFVRRDDTVVFVFRDRAGVAQGFYTITFLPFEFEGAAGLLFFSKYFYFRRDFRGHYKALLAPWLLIPLGVRRYGLRSLHFVTSTFPQSYVSLTRSSGNTRALHDVDITPWQAAALRHFATEIYGEDFDAVEGVVKNQNTVDTPGLARSAEAKRLTEHFERLNPDWKSGQSLPIIFSFDATLVRTALTRTVKRALRR